MGRARPAIGGQVKIGRFEEALVCRERSPSKGERRGESTQNGPDSFNSDASIARLVVSAAPVSLTPEDRKGLERYLLWQYRREKGGSMRRTPLPHKASLHNQLRNPRGLKRNC